MSLWLSEEELIELTGYKTARRQKMALGEMNVPFRSRAADSFPLVDRWQFEGEIVRPKERRRDPRFEWLQEPSNKKPPRRE